MAVNIGIFRIVLGQVGAKLDYNWGQSCVTEYIGGQWRFQKETLDKRIEETHKRKLKEGKTKHLKILGRISVMEEKLKTNYKELFPDTG